ncbi:carboxylesterase family protein [Hyphomonas sp.]|uniref:carboxylesterase/lipase family protein n=4 Tax=Hyphomonas sp. TaxID=87 RepID=UPI0032676843
MKMLLCVLTVMAGTCLMACQSKQAGGQTVLDTAPVVDTPAGALRGVREGEANVFRAIPYAMPPTGNRRWSPPKSMSAWEGIRDAQVSGPACIQPPKAPGLYYTDPPEMSEDCLLLDVTAPKDAENAPVMIWIHGGTLIWGSSQTEKYDGHALAERGVVLISVSYRLGALGFMAHPELSQESPDNVSGNYGLLDQIAALEWVRKNIEAFGGDPDNVTIFGESAGALSVEHLLASPLAHGLYHKAIVQSGYLYTMPELRTANHGLPSAEAIGEYVAAQLGAEDLAALRAIDGENLINRTAAAGYMPSGTVDGKVLKRQLVDTFDEGEQARVPLMAGYTSGEIRSLRGLLPPLPESPSAYEDDIRARYGEFADRYLEYYPPGGDADQTRLDATRDVIFTWGIERMVRQQAELGQPSYQYYFTHSYPAADEAGVPAFHASEVPYVFGNLSNNPEFWPEIPNTLEELAVSAAMLDYWTSFARDGVPASPNGPEWKTFEENQAYMEFGDEPRLRHDLLPGVHELQEEIFCRRREAGNQPWDWRAGSIAPPVPVADIPSQCARTRDQE